MSSVKITGTAIKRVREGGRRQIKASVWSVYPRTTELKIGDWWLMVANKRNISLIIAYYVNGVKYYHYTAL